MTRNVREALFGRANIHRTVNRRPDPERLRAPFKVPSPCESNEVAIAHSFCRGRGLVAEVNDVFARRLAGEAEMPFDGSVPTGIYFESNGCAFCADGEALGLTVKPLPPLPHD